jgi:hypothetical protein
VGRTVFCDSRGTAIAVLITLSVVGAKYDIPVLVGVAVGATVAVGLWMYAMPAGEKHGD